MTEQQEFLDYLKNPTKARIKEGVSHFQSGKWAGILTIDVKQSIEQDCENEYSIEIVADNFGILLSTTMLFANSLKRFMKNPIINCHTGVKENFDGTFRLIYYVTEA